MTIQIRHLILRYGVFVLLVLMSAGILFSCAVMNFELRHPSTSFMTVKSIVGMAILPTNSV